MGDIFAFDAPFGGHGFDEDDFGIWGEGAVTSAGDVAISGGGAGGHRAVPRGGARGVEFVRNGFIARGIGVGFDAALGAHEVGMRVKAAIDEGDGDAASGEFGGGVDAFGDGEELRARHGGSALCNEAGGKANFGGGEGGLGCPCKSSSASSHAGDLSHRARCDTRVIMEAWVDELICVWQNNRVEIAQLMLEAVETNPWIPVKGYRIEDVLQIFDGVLAMMQEELLQTGTEVRDTYMNVVIPGLLAQGQPLDALVGQATMNAVLINALISSKAKEQYRSHIARYVATFYARLNTEMMKIAKEAGFI